jgi:hypothetical protein
MKRPHILSKPKDIKYHHGVVSWRRVPRSTEYYLAISQCEKPSQKVCKERRALYCTSVSQFLCADGIVRIRICDLEAWNKRCSLTAGLYLFQIFSEAPHPSRPRAKIQSQVCFSFRLSPHFARIIRRRADLYDSTVRESRKARLRITEPPQIQSVPKTNRCGFFKRFGIGVRNTIARLI